MKPSELIRQRGWCQFHESQREDESPLTTWEAMLECGLTPVNDPRVKALCDSLPRGLVDWSLLPGRTAEQVIAKLEEVEL